MFTIAQNHVQFCFPWKNLRAVKTRKWESVCADRPRSCFINPRKPCYREAGTTATGSEKGTFLHPALLGCRTMTKLLTHTQWPLAWIFSLRATYLLTAGCTLSSVICTPLLVLVVQPFTLFSCLISKISLILKVTLGSQDQESGIKKKKGGL